MAFERIKNIWNKVARAIEGETPVNAMDCYAVRHIQQQVIAQTGFNVACEDSRDVNWRVNVGLVMPPSTPAEQVAKAEDAFIAAAMEKNVNLERAQIMRYVPGTTSAPSLRNDRRPAAW